MKAWSGRYNRTTYWLLVGMVLIALVIMAQFPGKRPLSVSEAVLMMIAVPRLHDIGKSGWWSLVGVAAEVILAIVSILFLPPAYVTQAMGVAVLIIAGLMIWLGCKQGDPFKNAWGEPPTFGIRSLWPKR